MHRETCRAANSGESSHHLPPEGASIARSCFTTESGEVVLGSCSHLNTDPVVALEHMHTCFEQSEEVTDLAGDSQACVHLPRTRHTAAALSTNRETIAQPTPEPRR